MRDNPGIRAFDRWAAVLLHDVPRHVAAALFLAGLALNFINIVGRYVFLRPIMSAEEILVYLMIWCIFLGAAIVTFQGSHLRMDLLTMHLGHRLRRLFELAGAIVFLALAIVIVAKSADIVGLVVSMDEKSVVARVPMEIPYAALPVSFALMGAAVVWRLVLLVRGVNGMPKQ